jgi:hypothetical protein
MAALTYFTEDDEQAPTKKIAVEFGGVRGFEVSVLDGESGKISTCAARDLLFEMKPLTTIFIKER